jgi:hypothetical protein
LRSNHPQLTGPRACSTVRPRAASDLFNLPGFEVVHVCRDDTGGRLVRICTTATEGACPSCGVVSGSVHQSTRRRVRDVRFDGPIVVWWLKKRWWCREQLCPGRSFTERTERVLPRARMTTRLTVLLLDAVTKEVRAVSRVAAEHGVPWPTVVRLLTAAADVLAARPVRPVPGGRDRRRNRPRRRPSGRRCTRCSRTLACRSTTSTSSSSLTTRSSPSGGAARGGCGTAAAARSTRRGRTGCFSCGARTPSPLAVGQLSTVLTIDDLTNQIGAAWGIKEQLRNVLRATTIAERAPPASCSTATSRRRTYRKRSR